MYSGDNGPQDGALGTLPPAERVEVRSHQRRQSQARGREVTLEEALQDWLQNHAQAWREARQRECLIRQQEEILKHKWIESEKAHRDLGSDAVFDWISKYAAEWRKLYEQEELQKVQAGGIC